MRRSLYFDYTYDSSFYKFYCEKPHGHCYVNELRYNELFCARWKPYNDSPGLGRYFMGLIADHCGFGLRVRMFNARISFQTKDLYELALKDYCYIKDFTGALDTHSEICFNTITL